jgi:hypothetical protein
MDVNIQIGQLIHIVMMETTMLDVIGMVELVVLQIPLKIPIGKVIVQIANALIPMLESDPLIHRACNPLFVDVECLLIIQFICALMLCLVLFS